MSEAAEAPETASEAQKINLSYSVLLGVEVYVFWHAESISEVIFWGKK